MNRTKKLILILLSGVIVIAVIAGLFLYFSRDKELPDQEDQPDSTQTTQEPSPTYSDAELAGMQLSYGNCEGTGPIELVSPPMHEEDFASITPYGMTIGGHVTPIDHQYFNPTVFYSPRDTYEVLAMADGKIVEIQRRLDPQNDTDEYRIVFMHTCTFFTYFDLVTSLAPDIMSVYEGKQSQNYASELDIEVVAGQVIGYIGGQTLDFAVWNTEEPLDGFVVLDHYEREPWKQYTADPYEYYSEELLPLMIEKNLRTAEPIAGKIDYDIDGRLIGNWFMEGTNWYAGDGEPYYSGHLSIHPDHIDPTAYWVSVGDFEGSPRQFLISTAVHDPKEVSTDTGLVYYDLMDYVYVEPDGSMWDRQTPVDGVRLELSSQNNGCVLFQVLEERKLTAEFIPDIPCDLVRTPGQFMRTYER